MTSSLVVMAMVCVTIGLPAVLSVVMRRSFFARVTKGGFSLWVDRDVKQNDDER